MHHHAGGRGRAPRVGEGATQASTGDRPLEGAAGTSRGPNSEKDCAENGEVANTGEEQTRGNGQGDPRRDPKTLPRDGGRNVAPGHHGCQRHQRQEGDAGRCGHRVEVGRADRDLHAIDGLVQQWEHGSQQDHDGQTHEDNVVGHEEAFT